MNIKHAHVAVNVVSSLLVIRDATIATLTVVEVDPLTRNHLDLMKMMGRHPLTD